MTKAKEKSVLNETEYNTNGGEHYSDKLLLKDTGDTFSHAEYNRLLEMLAGASVVPLTCPAETVDLADVWPSLNLGELEIDTPETAPGFATDWIYCQDIDPAYSGRVKRVCGMDGEWERFQSYCRLEKCSEQTVSIEEKNVFGTGLGREVDIEFPTTEALMYTADIACEDFDERFTGTVRRQCVRNGGTGFQNYNGRAQWRDVEGNCFMKQCPRFEVNSNGVDVAFDSTLVGSTATESCWSANHNYVGTLERTCVLNPDGSTSWGEVTGECALQTCSVSSVNVGVIGPDTRWPDQWAILDDSVTVEFPETDVRTTATVECSDFDSHYMGSIDRRCDRDGQPYARWRDVSEDDRCILRTCNSSTITDANGVEISFPRTGLGLSAEGICESGYTGTVTAECSEDENGVANWTNISGSCSETYCPAGNVYVSGLGDVYWDAYLAGTGLVYKDCYEINNNYTGSITRNCSRSGDWFPGTNNCTRRASDCPQGSVRVPSLGVDVTFNSTGPSGISTRSCSSINSSYEGTLRRTCGSNGTWAGLDDGCTLKTSPTSCPGETIDYTTMITRDNVQVPFPSTALGNPRQVSCSSLGEGFTSGSVARQCQANGVWSSTIQDTCQRSGGSGTSTCEADTTRQYIHPDGGWHDIAFPETPRGDQVRISCSTYNSEYTGNITRTCVGTNSWGAASTIGCQKVAPPSDNYQVKCQGSRPAFNIWADYTCSVTCDAGYSLKNWRCDSMTAECTTSGRTGTLLDESFGSWGRGTCVKD